MPAMNPTEGQFIKYEADKSYSRDNVTVLSGETLVTGQVVGIVTATGKVRAWAPANTDGSQNAAGIMTMNVTATGGDRPGVMIARHAEIVGRDHLIYAGTPTNPQKDTAVASLRARGILARATV